MSTMLPGSGNYLVDLHERLECEREKSKRRCPDCYGDGEKDVTFKEFKEWLENKFCCDTNIIKDALALYREWKKTGKIYCDKCEGSGYIYEGIWF